MALFGRDYDNDYGSDFHRGGGYGSRSGMHGSNRERGFNDRPGYGDAGSARGGLFRSRYDQSYQSRGGYGSDYDRNYKSQAQTDYGDPFGDRQSNTPMRVIRGEYESRNSRYDNDSWFGRDRNRNDSGWFGRDRNRYEADYSSNPMGYDPYRNRESSMERGWGARGFNQSNQSSRYGRDFRDDRY
ncbi:hypothetical protein BH23GEM6_BH23GEM6_16600 [soil metagenome]